MPFPTDRITAYGPQPAQPDEGFGGMAGFGLGLAGVGAAGFVPVRSGRRVWDYYLSGIRAAETGFPGAILRTFRTSEFLSPLESWAQLSIQQQELGSSTLYGQYLRQTVGEDVLSATAARGRGIFGPLLNEEGTAIGMTMRVASGTQRGEAIVDYFARLRGLDLGSRSLREEFLRTRYAALGPVAIPYDEWVKNLSHAEKFPGLPLSVRFREEIDVFGKKIKLNQKHQALVAQGELLKDFLRAKSATTAGRLNTLLRKPFEIPLIGDVLQKIPFVKNLAIQPGSHTEMVGGYLRKGLALGGTFAALSYYDFLRSRGGVAPTVLGTAGGAVLGGIFGQKHGRPFSVKGGIAGAAIGAFTALSPRFDKGLFHGAMSLVTDLNLLRAQASEATGLQSSLAAQEEVTPGLLSAKTAIGFTGVGALLAGIGGYGKLAIEAGRRRVQTGLPLAEVFENIRQEWYGLPGETGRFGEWWSSKFGGKLAKIPVVGKRLAKIKSPMMAGALVGATAWLAASTVLPILSGNFMAAIPGLNLLGTEETSEKLQAIYSGEEEVPVRKGRWWEMGRSTAYEGGRVEYYRPHALKRLEARAYEKGIYGDEEEEWEYSPLLHPLNALFGSDEWKYHYEMQHQMDRPAPLSSTYGDEIPFIGPLVAATFGRLVKPRKYIRPDEWMLGGGEFAYQPARPKEEPVYELGGLRPGAPVSPEDPKEVMNQLLYRRREAIGLMGFAAGSIAKGLTGREEPFANQTTLASMGGETGGEYWLWKHLNVGGGILTSEPVRRFIPRSPSYLETYNPLENNMPSWLPDDYFIDLKHGNPFDKIAEAELRLPGSGYEALHPEVAGLAPEEYPLVHRLKILSDIAMWSPEYRETLAVARSQRPRLSEAHQRMLETIEEQVRVKKQRREFDEYRFRDQELSSMQVTVRSVEDPRNILTEELGELRVRMQGVGAVNDTGEAGRAISEALVGKQMTVMVPSIEGRRFDLAAAGPVMPAVGMIGDVDYGQWLADQGLGQAAPLKGEFSQLRFGAGERAAGAFWESMTRAAETPYEMLTPLSPASKFIRKRSAIEEYIATEGIGTGSAFWDKPFANFFGPAQEMAEYKLGDTGIPGEIKRRRAVEQYFDMLEWQKAQITGDKTLTMFGLSPFASPTTVMTSMPRRSRDFFQAFSDARTEEDRQTILSLVSQQEQRIYLGQWMREQATALRAKQEARLATREDAIMLNQIMMARRSDGYSYDDAIEAEWRNETGGQVEFSEWLKARMAAEYFRTHSLPGPDNIMWHPAVDLEDVKAKYLANEGLDHHEYDIWGDRMRSLSRKPYLSDEMISELESPDELAEEQDLQRTVMMRNARALRLPMKGSSANIRALPVGSPGLNRYNIKVEDRRQGLVNRTMRELGVNG